MLNEPLRKCYTCGLEARTEEDLKLFVEEQRGKFGRRNWCLKCASEYSKDYGRKRQKKLSQEGFFHSPEYRIYRRNKARRQKERWKKRIIELMGGKCAVCGYSKCVAALEVHHSNPYEKEANLSVLIASASWQKIEQEIKKATLLCANCHREIHYENLDKRWKKR